MNFKRFVVVLMVVVVVEVVEIVIDERIVRFTVTVNWRARGFGEQF